MWNDGGYWGEMMGGIWVPITEEQVYHFLWVGLPVLWRARWT